MNPVLSGIADRTGNKKLFLKIFNGIGVIGCMSMFFFIEGRIWVGLLGSFLASIGYSGSLVFYNAYLPEIATEDRQDEISAKGFSYGYFGSALFLIAVLVSTFVFGDTEESKHLIFRITFLVLGLWWLGFAAYSFKRLPENVYEKSETSDWLRKGLKELKGVFKDLSNHPILKKYLLAFFMFSIAVQTMILVAAFFGSKEIEFPEGWKEVALIGIVLVIQFVAIAGAKTFAWVSKKYGNINGLLFGVISYTIACIWAFFTYHFIPFIFLAALVGFGMGGIQSLARSTYSKFLPETEDHASYFSFYDFLEKMSIVLGLLLFGGLEQLTGSQRYSVLSLVVVFLIAIVLLLRLRKQSK
jgi:UMF1 family MFS transporter